MAAAPLKPRDPAHLRAVIFQAGYDTVRLADITGITKQYVSLLLTGKRGCSPTVADAIAQALNLTTTDLFTSDSLFGEKNNTMEEVVPAPVVTDDPYLLFDEVADLARMEPGTLRHLRHLGQGPEFFKIGRRLMIRESKARAWIEAYETAAP
jgi:transcriptional regulator with XRE-family HTH domain